MANLTIALAGNPNAGKTTIFNSLTGLHQHTGNWTGKTVEKKEGEIEYNNLTINMVDLPGTYSLTAYSPEEIAARDFIIHEQPDVVINVIDATNLERNLYLTIQNGSTITTIGKHPHRSHFSQSRQGHFRFNRQSRTCGSKKINAKAAQP